jgi:hypothetical protein
MESLVLGGVEARLLRRKLVMGDCWRYNGATSPGGYGWIFYDGRPHFVHRVSAMLYLELDLNDKLKQVNHKRECPNKDCFNPNHLYIGNQVQNMSDAMEIGVKFGHNHEKTHCKQGHEFTPENTKIKILPGRKPSRFCKQCHRDQEQRRRDLIEEKR